MLPEVGPARLRAITEHFGNPAAALGASVNDLRNIPYMGQRAAEILSNWEQHCNLQQELLRTKSAGIQIVTCEDPDYPMLLREIHDPPICLYVRGSLQALDTRATIAMVGSRFTTQYGLSMANVLATQACQEGWTVVSGLARGVDTAAHAAAVRAGGKTVAVLGSGMQWVYPNENLQLARAIADSGGAVITEYQMQQRPDRRNFPIRNRIISGMSRGTLVVEAGLQSGSLITANQASEQGRTVFAVPGRADSPHSQGCHALLRDGARIVETFQDVLDEFNLLPSLNEQRQQREQKAQAETCRSIPVSEKEFLVWQEIGDEEATIDGLVAKLNQPASMVLGTLLSLEIKQLIRQLPGKRIHRCPNRIAVRDDGTAT